MGEVRNGFTSRPLLRQGYGGLNWKGIQMTQPILIDSFGRTIDYLRISVTERCNFRCVYCMPPEGIPHLSRDAILTFEEITRVARLFLEMGGRKLRITGGEPLVRSGVADLAAQLAKLPGLKELGLTTNGFHLKELARPLKEAGLKKINISLDSLRPSRFEELTRCSQFEKVWAGIEQAVLVGLKTKINVVVLKGISEEEVLGFGDLARRLPIEVRFIEFMPLCGTGWHPEWMLPLSEIRTLLKNHHPLIPLPRGSEVAESYRIEGGEGRLGFIASMTEPFCHNCSRMRLTAEGKLRPCLFSNLEIDLKPWLRGGWPDTDIMATILEAVQKKPVGHQITFPIQDAAQLPKIRFVGG